MLEITEGSLAVADAVGKCRPQVIAAYPITPQTHIVEALAEMAANCTIDAEYITVESEFSALSACLGASAAGSRVYSATTSQGLALMFEVCFNCAGMRLPVVMSIANRAMGAPLSIWNDQQDSISLRDSGWLQSVCRGQPGSDRPPLPCVQGLGRPPHPPPLVCLLRRVHPLAYL